MTTVSGIKAFEVRVSNGSFWSHYLVAAATREEAEALVLADANRSTRLDEEAAAAAQIGETPAGAYTVYEVRSEEDLHSDDVARTLERNRVTLTHSGAEG